MKNAASCSLCVLVFRAEDGICPVPPCEALLDAVCFSPWCTYPRPRPPPHPIRSHDQWRFLVDCPHSQVRGADDMHGRRRSTPEPKQETRDCHRPPQSARGCRKAVNKSAPILELRRSRLDGSNLFRGDGPSNIIIPLGLARLSVAGIWEVRSQSTTEPPPRLITTFFLSTL